jgi:hypothetical protein
VSETEPNDNWLRDLAEIYFEIGLHPEMVLDPDDPDGDRHTDAICAVDDLRENPETAWRFIQICCETLQLTDDQLGLLGAGLFEDLMDDAGRSFIDRVEAGYRTSEPFREVVNAVWTMSMSGDVADRIDRLKGASTTQTPR